MNSSRTFSSIEESNEYYNYLVIDTSATRSYHTTSDVICGYYHTKKQAENFIYNTPGSPRSAEVFTRKQAVKALDYMREEQIQKYGESFISPYSIL